MKPFLAQLTDEERFEALAQIYLELLLPPKQALDAARADLLNLDGQKEVAEADWWR